MHVPLVIMQKYHSTTIRVTTQVRILISVQSLMSVPKKTNHTLTSSAQEVGKRLLHAPKVHVVQHVVVVKTSNAHHTVQQRDNTGTVNHAKIVA